MRSQQGRGRNSGDLLLVGGQLLAGALVGVLWRLLGSALGSADGGSEAQIANDAALAIGCTAAGLAFAVGALVRPGPRPLRRMLALFVGAALGCGTALAVGDLLLSAKLGFLKDATALHASAVLLFWPLAAALVTFVGALIPAVGERLESRPAPQVPYSPNGEAPFSHTGELPYR